MINLLPQSEKKILQIEEKEKIVLILETLSFIFLLCLILILASIQIYIWGQVEAEKIILEQEKREFEVSEVKDLPEKIKLANKTFSDLNSFYQSQIKSTEILEELSKTLPQGVYLTNLSYQKRTSQVIVSGFSKNREILFEFKKNLEQEESFQDIYFPPSTWIEAININFNMSLKIKDESKT